MSRVRVYNAEEIARDIRETFTAKPVQKEVKFPFGWPRHMQHVGDSLAVAYSSDKWKREGDYIAYKHLAESRNRALCVPGFLRDFDRPSEPWPAIGPMVSFDRMPMPKHFAILALFEEVNLKLYTRGTHEEPGFGRGRDDGVVMVTVAHGMLGGSKILWSEKYDVPDEPFLFIYDERSGPLMMIVGDELDIREEGIVG
jgi:hypothetical protein